MEPLWHGSPAVWHQLSNRICGRTEVDETSVEFEVHVELIATDEPRRTPRNSPLGARALSGVRAAAEIQANVRSVDSIDATTTIQRCFPTMWPNGERKRGTRARDGASQADG